MFLMANENNINLKIADDPNYQLSEEEIANNTKVVIFIKANKDT